MHNREGRVRSKNGRKIHSKVLLVPQKMLSKTWNLEMVVSKAASRGNDLIFCEAVNSKPERKSNSSQVFFKDFD